VFWCGVGVGVGVVCVKKKKKKRRMHTFFFLSTFAILFPSHISRQFLFQISSSFDPLCLPSALDVLSIIIALL
jgi:hypothetical protein